MKRLIVVGANRNGQASVVTDCVSQLNDIEIVGYLDSNLDLIGKPLFNNYVFGDYLNICTLDLPKFDELHIAIGDNCTRKSIYAFLTNKGFTIASLISPEAYISSKSIIHAGTFVGARASIQAGATIGYGTLINSGAIIEHNSTIGDFVHIASGTITGGRVVVDDLCVVGLGARLLPDIVLGHNSTVGAGAVVTCNVAENTRVVGIPAKTLLK